VKSLVPLLLLALLTGCSSAINPIEPPTPLEDFRPELKVEHRWVHQLGKGSYQQFLKLVPLIDGERVFQADNHGRVVAYESATGKRLWRVTLDATINSGPGGSSDLLLFGGDAEVLALNKSDGSVAWRAAVTSEVLSIPAQKGNTVVVHSVDGNIIALDAANGKMLWRYSESVPTLSLRGSGNPVIVDDTVLLGTANGKVVALGLSDGGLRWEANVAVPHGRSELERMVDVDGNIAISDGVVYASSYGGNLVALLQSTGQLLWTREIASATGITVDADKLYVSDTVGDVWALSRRGGGTMWKQTALHQRSLSAPVQQGNYIIVGDYDGYLHWISKEDGHLAGRARIRQWQDYFPLPDDDVGAGPNYPEDRSVLMPPAVEGAYVFGLDKRGVLDVFQLAPIVSEAD